ncbi:MAG: hypothetical protein HY565_01365 [Candidatus Kerfeldbacteria bacterium]|nr:hypothetical protein [Candidatus Kerfeldbacteria bacterium]
MVFNPDDGRTIPKLEAPRDSAEGYQERADRLRELSQSFQQDIDPQEMDPEARRRNRETLRSLLNAMDNVPWLSGMDPKTAAEALIKYFDDRAATADQAELKGRGLKVFPKVRVEERVPVSLPRAEGEVIRLPKLEDKKWEIVRIDVRNRKYVLADPKDRRPVSDIVSDVRAGKSVGHEVGWDELEEMAA